MAKKKNAPVEEEVKNNVVDLWAEENEAEMHIESEAKEEKAPVEEKKNWKVTIEEVEYKSVNLMKAPEEIKKIIQFYGITSKDLFEWKFDGVKDDEVKMLKEWYATLA